MKRREFICARNDEVESTLQSLSLPATNATRLRTGA
jgi:hypothetical protein